MSIIDRETESLARAPDVSMPWWAKALGARWYDGGPVRAKWGEITFGPTGFALKVGAYETAHLRIALFWVSAFIRLPFLDWMGEERGSMESPHFGFSFHATDVHLSWGRRTKVINFPWQARYLFREFLAADGRWLPDDQRARSWATEQGVEALKIVLPYHYLLHGGETQTVAATLVRQRYSKVWTWFGESTHPRALGHVIRPRKAWLSDSLRSLQRRLTGPIHTLDIEFDGEVGERAGSWKGGCVGCGWDMKPGESVQAALARMQATRRFR